MTGTPGESVGQRMQLIRDLVTVPRVQRQLMENRLQWFRLCSAMDALEDTDQALAAHRGRAWESKTAAVGLRYLAHYGFLQAAYVQQDALRTLYEVLGLPFDRAQFPKLGEIRKLRHDAIGHPTGRKDGSSHAIVQISMTADGFELGSWTHSGLRQRSVDLDEVAAEQNNGMVEALDRLIIYLTEQDRRHKDLFVNQPLAPKMSRSNLGYALEKISVGARTISANTAGSDAVMARAGLDVVTKTLTELKDALRERGEYPDVLDSIDHLFGELDSAIDRLTATFAQEPSGLDSEAAGVYAHFLRGKLSELEGVLAAIDEDYASS
jgi:hypothetical protein